MGFTELELYGKKLFERFPIMKRSIKRIYQLINVAMSHEKYRTEGLIERVTPKDEFEYFYGYYDKSPWDASDRYMIAMQVKHTNKSVAPKQEAIIGLIDTANNNCFHKIGSTRAWNVQQGCMAQWLGPDFKTRIIYNDFRDGKYCSIVYNTQTMSEENRLPLPVYDVAKDGTFALSLDFSRLHRMRPGYGYSNMEEVTKCEPCPNVVCIWKMEIPSGIVTELFKYTDFFEFQTVDSMKGAEHKVNHIMINPNGTRFMVLHRWIQKGRKFTRLVTVNVDGTDMYNLSDDVFVSHCYWKNEHEILGFLRKRETRDHYYLLQDKSKEYKIQWHELNTDGHCSYSPDGRLIITDTYPNRKRLASVYLCVESDNKFQKIGKVYSPFKYDNECRCDLHPRWNRKGDKICIDSVHEGKRGMYVIQIQSNDENELINVTDREYTVVVVMATYNGEKYLREQLESLLRQKGVKVHIIVRDDGSQDSTVTILNEYQKRGLLTWYTGEHLNVQKGYLNLLQKTPEAEFYAFCDQDDVWDDDKLLNAVTKLEKMPNNRPCMYYCGQRLVDEKLNLLSVHNIDTTRSDHANFLISNVAGCTAVFNKELRNAVNSARPNFILMHDSWLFKVCMALGGTYYADAGVHISYRQHGENVVGLKRGIKGKLHQVRRYLEVFEIQKQCQSLLDCYGNRMTLEYKKLTEEICNYDKSIINWLKFLFRRDMNFRNKGLNCVVKLKILLRKM